MSIHVTDFKWEKGKNDLEYIALLEKNLDAMLGGYRECSKVAREQYKRGYQKGKADGANSFAEWLQENVLIDTESGVTIVCGKEYTRIVSFLELYAEWQKGTENGQNKRK